MIKLNGIQIEPTIFPDNTIQVWKIPGHQLICGTQLIEWEFENNAEIIILAQLKFLLDNIDLPLRCNLSIPYLPYARQDKPVSNATTFGLHIFANIINNMNFDEVTAFDVHSNVAESLIRNFKWVRPNIDHILNLYNVDEIIYPDKGALYKYTQFITYPFMYAEKIRDQLTGEITKLEFYGDVKECNLLIVDDLCDGGATFIALAKELIDRGADEVNLYVSHGLFSKGTQILRDAGIKNIWTRKGLIE